MMLPNDSTISFLRLILLSTDFKKKIGPILRASREERVRCLRKLLKQIGTIIDTMSAPDHAMRQLVGALSDRPASYLLDERAFIHLFRDELVEKFGADWVENYPYSDYLFDEQGNRKQIWGEFIGPDLIVEFFQQVKIALERRLDAERELAGQGGRPRDETRDKIIDYLIRDFKSLSRKTPTPGASSDFTKYCEAAFFELKLSTIGLDDAISERLRRYKFDKQF